MEKKKKCMVSDHLNKEIVHPCCPPKLNQNPLLLRYYDFYIALVEILCRAGDQDVQKAEVGAIATHERSCDCTWSKIWANGGETMIDFSDKLLSWVCNANGYSVLAVSLFLSAKKEMIFRVANMRIQRYCCGSNTWIGMCNPTTGLSEEQIWRNSPKYGMNLEEMVLALAIQEGTVTAVVLLGIELAEIMVG